MKENSRKMWLLGILGCICFGIGDWLLGYVDPGVVGAEFHVIRLGHGVDYNLTRVTITLFLGVVGMVFLIPGFRAQADILKDEKGKTLHRYLMTLCTVSWIVIHTTVSTGIYIYSWCTHKGDAALAQDLTIDLMNLFQPMQLVSYVFLAVAFIVQIADIVRGKTILKRWGVLFTPLIWMGIFSAIAKVLPVSPLANGLDTFCMNAGMMIWLGYLCVSSSKR